MAALLLRALLPLHAGLPAPWRAAVCGVQSVAWLVAGCGISVAQGQPAADVADARAETRAEARTVSRAEAHARADAAFAEALLGLINQLRAGQGLAAWQPDGHLQQIAADHGRALARQGRLSHGGFDDRLSRSGASLCVENLAAGPAEPAQLVAAWLASPGHRANLLEPQAQRAGLARRQGVVVLLACRADGGLVSVPR